MEERIRTFVAVEVPDSVKAVIGEAVQPVRRRVRVRWTRPEGWHLTLKFLGEITRAQVNVVIEVTRAVAAELSSFRVAFGGWGAFPTDRRPRVLWMGVREGGEALAHAAGMLDERLAERGFPPEDRPFHPHLTIARIAVPNSGIEAYERLQRQDARPEPFVVDHLVVFRSILDRAGAQYHPLAVCTMGVQDTAQHPKEE